MMALIAAGLTLSSRIFTTRRFLMESMYYIGLDIHKKIIAFCIKTVSGRLIKRAGIPGTSYLIPVFSEPPAIHIEYRVSELPGKEKIKTIENRL